MTCGGAGYDGAPEERVGGEVCACGEAGDEDGGWVRPDEVADVEDAADPAVLLAVEVLLGVLVIGLERVGFGTDVVFWESKDCGGGEDGLVHEVEHVCYE